MMKTEMKDAMKMKSTRWIIPLAAASLGALAIVLLTGIFGRERPADRSADLEADALRTLRNYRSWTRVNPRPYPMDPMVASLCAAASPALASGARSGPHAGYYLTVYVNDTARHAMMQEAKPRFPVGSLIVKEKLPPILDGRDTLTGAIASHPAPDPELMTVMLKREKGYDSPNGDWEYIVLDGHTREATKFGRLEECQGCHLEKAPSDYIFRTYLPTPAQPGNE